MTITYPDFQRKRGTTKEFYLLLVLDFNLVLITEPHLHTLQTQTHTLNHKQNRQLGFQA